MTYVANATCKECGHAKPADTLDSDGVCPRCRLTVIPSNPNPVLEDQPMSKGENVTVTFSNGEVLTGEISEVEEDLDGATKLTVLLW